eukprot:gene15701-18618_t
MSVCQEFAKLSMADDVIILVSDEEDGDSQQTVPMQADAANGNEHGPAAGAGPSGTGGNQQPVPMHTDAAYGNPAGAGPSVGWSRHQGADVKKLLQTFTVEATSALETAYGEETASTLEYEALQQVLLVAGIGVTKIESAGLRANSGPEFTRSSAEVVLLFGIEHGSAINDGLAPACRTMLDNDENLTVISENCPGYAHTTSTDININVLDAQFRQLSSRRAEFIDIRQASVMGVVESPLLYRDVTLQRIAATPSNSIASPSNSIAMRDMMISLISGAHDTISCLVASCNPDISRDERRVPADGYAISDVLLNYDASTVKMWPPPWLESIKVEIKNVLRRFTEMCKVMDDLLEFMLQLVLPDDFMETETQLVIVFDKLLKYTEELDPADAMNYQKPTCIFMKLLAAHRATTTEVMYMRNVFKILGACGVTTMSLSPRSPITWKYLLAWMYVVAFHVSRMHEKADNEAIFAGWLTNGALDLVDARILTLDDWLKRVVDVKWRDFQHGDAFFYTGEDR